MVEVIAEAGSNHNGSVDLACQLVDVAREANAASIKFQFIQAAGLYLPKFRKGVELIDNRAFAKRVGEELSFDDWRKIWDYANARKIEISASVFCDFGVKMLGALGAPYAKIASTDCTNHHLIGKACQQFNHIIVSTGMASLAEIAGMVEFVEQNFPAVKLRLMHCVSVYPCPIEDAGLGKLKKLKGAFDNSVGYSDHTGGSVVAPVALHAGADFFEKHFTTDRALPGFDHAHALEPEELKYYVEILSKFDTAINGDDSVRTNEIETKIRARRGVYAARDLEVGEVIQPDDLLFVRPSTNLEINDPSVLVGRKVSEKIGQYQAVSLGSSVQSGVSNWERADAFWNKEMDEKSI